MTVGRIFASIPEVLASERVDEIARTSTVRIERILSHGHTSPASGWYDQDENEWVIVLQGKARLLFDDGAEVVLDVGDWIEIPAHRRHKVTWTDPASVTVWLAVFYR